MTEAVRNVDLLSREEIAALIDELEQARREEAGAGRLSGLATSGRDASLPHRILRGTLDRFAVEQARILSSRFQHPIEVRLLGLDELKAVELAEHLLPYERLVEFGSADTTSADAGLLMIARPLLFAWMRIAFGAPRERRTDPLPDRPPTPIEVRFLLRTAEEIVARIGAFALPPVDLAVRGLVEPRQVRESRFPRRLVASFDVSGFEEIGRIRVVFPRSLEPRQSDPGIRTRPIDSGLEREVLEMPVSVTARLGAAELALARLADLEVGSLIPLETDPEGLVALTVGGIPRFRGVRGQVGTRLAVQVMQPDLAEEE